MSRKYKFHNPEGIFFVSFATVYWIDVFIREQYFATMAESLEFCQGNKGLVLYAFCILPSHVHLIFRDSNNDPGKLMKEIKTYTSKELQKLILDNPVEAGFVTEPHYRKYSSAANYADEPGVIKIKLLLLARVTNSRQRG